MKGPFTRALALTLCLTLLLVGCGGASSATPSTTASASTSTPEGTASTTVATGDFPSKPIEMVVPFGAGGSTDAVARIFASVISKYLPNNQNIVIINEGGQATVRGTQIVANSPADGYRIGLVASQSAAQGQYIVANTTYDYDDFDYLMKVHSMPVYPQVLPTSDIKTFKDLTDRMGGTGDPVLVGVLGTKNAGGMALKELETKYNLKNIKPVPYDNNGLVFAALQQGTVDAIWCTNDKSFGFTCLAAGDLERSKAQPDVQTVSELGFPMIPSGTYTMIVTPKGVPADRLKIISDAFSEAMKDPAFVKAMEANEYEIDYKDSETLTKDIEVYAKQVKQFYIENNMMVNDPSAPKK